MLLAVLSQEVFLEYLIPTKGEREREKKEPGREAEVEGNARLYVLEGGSGGHRNEPDGTTG